MGTKFSNLTCPVAFPFFIYCVICNEIGEVPIPKTNQNLFFEICPGRDTVNWEETKLFSGLGLGLGNWW